MTSLQPTVTMHDEARVAGVSIATVAFVLTSSRVNRTLPLAIWDSQGKYGSDVSVIMAVLTLTALPLVLAYIFAQERIINGIMAGAVKQ